MTRPHTGRTRLAIAVASVVLVALIAGLDHATGSNVGVDLFYFAPLAAAAWYVGWPFGILLSAFSTGMAVLTGVLFLGRYPTLWHGAWDVVLHLGSFLIVSLLTAKVQRLLEHERETAAELRQSLEEIQELRSLIPICAWCKAIRNDAGYWGSVETYFGTHAGATFTHGICPDCRTKVMAG